MVDKEEIDEEDSFEEVIQDKPEPKEDGVSIETAKTDIIEDDADEVDEVQELLNNTY